MVEIAFFTCCSYPEVDCLFLVCEVEEPEKERRLDRPCVKSCNAWPLAPAACLCQMK